MNGNDIIGLGFKAEKAIRLLCKLFTEERSLTKPTLFHSIRVGNYLYKNGYPDHIVIAGFLHDVVEDTKTTTDEIVDLFGKNLTFRFLYSKSS